ncbi:MAG: competence/damage-inducible protein A [Eubacteriales bacterium]|nr:competence/damage-inducible protein A [Eubacteriales bacterium]
MKRAPEAEILSVGTELLLGHITNTDARDISEMLSRIGLNVKYHSVVGDNPERLRQCVEIARGRADVIITTGGLGPTCDDLTKQVVADCFGLKLVRSEEVEKSLYEYIRTGRGLTPNTHQQALLPEGCTVFPNSCGTAPGCAFEKDGKVVVMLPGPPKECRAMFERSALPYLRRLSGEVIVSHSLNIFGIGESAVDDLFAAEMNAMTNPSMAPYAKECDCLLQITAKAESEAEAEAMIAPVRAHVLEVLGEYVYGEDVDCIEEAVMALLREHGKTFAACESCTGGDIARRFTELPGASAFFLGGAVTYTNAVKTKLAGVPEALLAEKTAVSREVAQAMAEGVRERLGADLAVSVTGLAGPDGDGVHEVGTVFIALAAEGQTWVRETHMGERRTRSFIRRMAGNHAFDMLRRYLSGMKVE